MWPVFLKNLKSLKPQPKFAVCPALEVSGDAAIAEGPPGVGGHVDMARLPRGVTARGKRKVHRLSLEAISEPEEFSDEEQQPTDQETEGEDLQSSRLSDSCPSYNRKYTQRDL